MIVSNGPFAIRAVKEAAGSIPIVMAVIDDPVGLGFAQSLAHPGGNLTGQSNLAEGLVGKRIEMLLEAVPDPGCVAVLHDHVDQADDPLYWQEIVAAARTLHTVLKPIAVRRADELPAAFSQISREHCQAVMVMSSALYAGARVQLVALAAQHRVAASYDNRVIVDAGGLMSYGPDTRDMWRRAATYVDKILKGAKPADLPIERPTKFEMVDQSHDRQGARPDDPAVDPRPCRRGDRMRRRDLLALVVGTAIASGRSARAQRRSLPLVAFLNPQDIRDKPRGIPARPPRTRLCRRAEYQLEVRSAEGDNRRLPALAAELAALKPDVIVTSGEPATRAVKEAAGTIPIVMAIVDDPVALGFAQSLARPGGNLTGLTILATDVLGKRLQMLYEIVPDPGCVAVLGLAGVNYEPKSSRELTAAAKALGVSLLPISVPDVNELSTGFAEMTRQHCRAVVVMSDPLFVYARQQLIELAAQHRIAASYDNRLIVDAGGLMSYGPDTVRYDPPVRGVCGQDPQRRTNLPTCQSSSRPNSSWSST